MVFLFGSFIFVYRWGLSGLFVLTVSYLIFFYKIDTIGRLLSYLHLFFCDKHLPIRKVQVSTLAGGRKM